MIFQEDVNCSHHMLPARQYLEQKSPSRWMGRGQHIPWIARSPDLASRDFILWGYPKDQVLRELLQSISDLKKETCHTVANITKESLRKVFQNFGNRLLFELFQDKDHSQTFQTTNKAFISIFDH